MPYFDQDHYIAQKVAQMNATNYVGRTGTAGTPWTAESATAELNAWGITWQQNFQACNGSGYASNINAAAINVSPNALFNVNEYAQALADYNNANSVNGQTNWTASSALASVLNSGHQSLLSHYTTTGAALGLNPSNAFDTMAWANAQAASTGQTAAQILSGLAARGQNPVEAYLNGGGTVEDAPAVAEDAVVVVPEGFSPWAVSGGSPTEPDVPAQPVYTNDIYLTPELDVIQGTDANDHIIGQEFDGVNTLQSGDRIDGGAGQDLLTADVTAGNTYGQILNTVRPEVHNVETIKFTSQQSTDTTHGQTAIAGIRADRIDGVTQLWNTNSRATLEIDDVRVPSYNTTIGWQDAENANAAGNNLDYVVRFNNQFLTAEDATTQGTLQLQVMDVKGAAQGEPLLENTYDALTFSYNGAQVRLDLAPYQEMISGASATYQTFLTAVQNALAANAACEGLTAALGPQFSYSPKDASDVSYTGTSIVITAADGTLAPGRWLASNGVDADSDLDTDMIQAQSTTCPLLSTNIALDNVGMVNWFDPSLCIPNNQQFGDYAGDMIVGGMGQGGIDTTNYVGLQRFDVTVDRGSWMSSLQSTNHALRMITVKNGDLDDADSQIGTSNADQGNLFIGDGQRLTNAAIAGGSLMFEGRDGMLADAALLYGPSDDTRSVLPEQHVGQTVASGIVDVAVFDAGAMTGKANISATVTEMASKKYLGDTDQVDALGNRFAPGQAFSYNFGTNDDTLNMNINGFVAADNDFKMNINMGDGNDSVHTQFDNGDGLARNWVANQFMMNNVVITTGNGDDIINPMGSGRVNVWAGAGNDVVYSDNSGIESDAQSVKGVGAIWVLNAASGEGNTSISVGQDGNLVPYHNEINSNLNYPHTTASVLASNGRAATLEVEVVYKGILARATTTLNMVMNSDGVNGTFQYTDRDMINLIMSAVNDKPAANGDSADLGMGHLHSILSAQEGAANSLMLVSKIDGVSAAPSIKFTLTQNNVPTGQTAQNLIVTSGDGIVPTSPDADITLAPATDENGNPLSIGESTANANNIISLGEGDDLVVLSSSTNAHETIVLNDGDNGHDYVVNFAFWNGNAAGGGQNPQIGGAFGGDFLDVSQILGAQASRSDVTGATNLEAPVGDNAKQIVWVQNAATTSDDYLANAADVQAQLQEENAANPQAQANSVVLYMVDHGPDTGASFSMYKAVYDASGSATVTDLGEITFADWSAANFENDSNISQLGVETLPANPVEVGLL